LVLQWACRTLSALHVFNGEIYCSTAAAKKDGQHLEAFKKENQSADSDLFQNAKARKEDGTLFQKV